MSSLVPNYIINPILRQARRLPNNLATPEPDPSVLPGTTVQETKAGHEDGGSRMGEDTAIVDNRVRGSSGRVPAPAPGSIEAAGPSSTRSLPRRFRMPSLQQTELGNGDDASATLQIPPTTRPTTALGIRGSEPISFRDLGRNVEPDVPSSLPTSFYGKPELPEDDGMGTLRRRIITIQSQELPLSEKARMMHDLLMEGYTRSQIAHARPETPSSPMISEQPLAAGPLDSFKFWHTALTEPSIASRVVLTEDDLRPTFAPLPEQPGEGSNGTASEGLRESRILGCEHYRRNVKLQCFTCRKWYTCRLCHNEAEDHVLPRRETKNMLCMICGHAQGAGDVCVKCGESAARYYCGICKLWNDDPDKSIYHCNDCGICRVGEGLGKDFIHCKKCGSCIAITLEDSHKCREGAMDCDCPICGEYMFTSHRKVVSMKCGHMIHEECRSQYIRTSYKCPICSKSVENMESQFRRLDKHLEEQPMPPEYQNTRAIILCNDCEAKTSTKYHWGGLKCEVCLSYNTVELQVLNSPVRSGPGGSLAEDSDVVVTTDNDSAATPPASFLQDMPTSRPPAHQPGTYLESRHEVRQTFSSITMPHRLARPVSPSRAHILLPEPSIATDESDQEEEILNFWGQDERRSFTSAENVEEGVSEGDDEDESDSDACDDDDEDDDDDDDEEEEIVLFGHR